MTTWIDEHGLNLATEKTEIVVQTRRIISRELEITVSTDVLSTKTLVKYLGLRLDSKMTFWEQTRSPSDKAAMITTTMSQLIANVDRSTVSRPRLLMTVTHYILLYGCEIRCDALRQDMYRNQMASLQRRGALRIASSYCTVSESAALLIAVVTPSI